MSVGKALLHYNPKLTEECLSVLALLLSGIGQWRDSVILIGGLTPEVLVKAKPPEVPAYVGTADVDLVMDLSVMANPDAYSTFEEVLKNNKFVPMGEDGKPRGDDGKPSWRWEYTTESGTKILLEFVADDPQLEEWRVRGVPEHGQLGALNIHKSSIVFDFAQTKTITAKLPGNQGVTKQPVRHADIVGFTILKTLAFRSRGEGKDAHDLIYCLRHSETPVEEIAARLVAAMKEKHAAVIETALAGLAAAFADEEGLEGYQKDGPGKAALFEIAGDTAEDRQHRTVLQREFADVVNKLLAAVAKLRQ